MSTFAEEASLALYEARQSGSPLLDLPERLVPATIEDAYAIQDVTLGRNGALAGWKVSAKPGAEPRCAVFSSRDLATSPATVDVSRMRPEVEVEVGLTLARDLPPTDRTYGEADVLAAIGSVHLAIELISSRFVNRKAVSPLSAIADHQSCSGVFMGPAVADWQAVDFATVDMDLSFDGTSVVQKAGGAGRAEVLPWLVWLANHAAKRNGGLRAGQVIITGARLGPAPAPGVRSVVATSKVLGRIELTLDGGR